MIKRILLNSDKKCLYKFVYNMGVKGTLSFRRYQKRLKEGRIFPGVSFHFGNRRLQPELPGVLGYRQKKQQPDVCRRVQPDY
jgi:hypothetical protein